MNSNLSNSSMFSLLVSKSRRLSALSQRVTAWYDEKEEMQTASRIRVVAQAASSMRVVVNERASQILHLISVKFRDRVQSNYTLDEHVLTEIEQISKILFLIVERHANLMSACWFDANWLTTVSSCTSFLMMTFVDVLDNTTSLSSMIDHSDTETNVLRDLHIEQSKITSLKSRSRSSSIQHSSNDITQIRTSESAWKARSMRVF